LGFRATFINGLELRREMNAAKRLLLLCEIENALRGFSRALSSCVELDCIYRRIAWLTPREWEVLAFFVKGRPNKQVACVLGIAKKTTKVHQARAMERWRRARWANW
jgi:FixJ family two-component response regulator